MMHDRAVQQEGQHRDNARRLLLKLGELLVFDVSLVGSHRRGGRRHVSHLLHQLACLLQRRVVVRHLVVRGLLVVIVGARGVPMRTVVMRIVVLLVVLLVVLMCVCMVLRWRVVF